MTTIDFVPPPVLPHKAPKEMLTLSTLPDGRRGVKINYSSLSLIQECKRKAYYVLSRGLVSNEESAATLTGSAVHAAMEVWYCAPRTARRKISLQCDDAQAQMLVGQAPVAHGECLRCASVFAYLEKSQALSALPLGDKRERSNLVSILNNYFDHYLDDPFVIASDASGPLCERRFEYLLYSDSALAITCHGTIDAVLTNVMTGDLVVCDHKTTASLGSEFYNRIRPNFQYTGYTYGAQQVLGLNTSLFMVNGIQVAKTRSGLARQITQINDTDIEEFRTAMIAGVKDYLHCLDSVSWPMTAPGPCSNWGGCQFIDVCGVPADMRESVLESKFTNNTQGSQ